MIRITALLKNCFHGPISYRRSVGANLKQRICKPDRRKWHSKMDQYSWFTVYLLKNCQHLKLTFTMKLIKTPRIETNREGISEFVLIFPVSQTYSNLTQTFFLCYTDHQTSYHIVTALESDITLLVFGLRKRKLGTLDPKLYRL